MLVHLGSSGLARKQSEKQVHGQDSNELHLCGAFNAFDDVFWLFESLTCAAWILKFNKPTILAFPGCMMHRHENISYGTELFEVLAEILFSKASKSEESTGFI